MEPKTNTVKMTAKDKMNEKRIIEFIKAKTDMVIKPTPEDTSDDMSAKLSNLLDDSGQFCSDGRKTICDILTLVLGKPFVYKPSASTKSIPSSKVFVKGALLVPLAAWCSHNYPVGQPALVLDGSSYLLKENGGKGNDLRADRYNMGVTMRVATAKEIENFVKEIGYNTIITELGVILI